MVILHALFQVIRYQLAQELLSRQSLCHLPLLTAPEDHLHCYYRRDLFVYCLDVAVAIVVGG